MASATNVTSATKSLLPLLVTSIGVPGGWPGIDWPAETCLMPSGVFLGELSGQHIKVLRSGMHMNRCLGPGRAVSTVDAQQVFGRRKRGHGPNLGDLAAARRGSAGRSVPA